VDTERPFVKSEKKDKEEKKLRKALTKARVEGMGEKSVIKMQSQHLITYLDTVKKR